MLFQGPASRPCDPFSFEYSFYAHIAEVLARLLSVLETLGANPIFMVIVVLGEVTVPTYNYDSLVRNHQYKHFVKSRLGFANGAENMQFLMLEGTTLAMGQLRMSQISFGPTLSRSLMNLEPFHKPLSSISSAFAISPLCTILYIAGQLKILWTVSMEFFCDVGFALLFGGKCHFVSLRVLWPHLLPRSDCSC